MYEVVKMLHSYWAYLVLLMIVVASLNALFKFFGIKASGNRVIFIIDASRFMLTDEKGGIPAYNKVKDEIAQMMAGLNR